MKRTVERDRESQLEDLFAAYVDRLNDGETLDAETILAENPLLGSELLTYLEEYLQADANHSPAETLGTLGDFKLLREIGRGGMGVVYEAWQNSMNRSVALKVLPGGFAADTKAVTRFVREAQVAGKLNHPNVVAVYGMGVVEKTPYYFMELVQGQTLADLFERHRGGTNKASVEDRNLLVSTISGLLGRAVSAGETPSGGAEPGRGTPESSDSSPSTSSLVAESGSDEYFRKIARSFAAVAEGLEHAHQQGIIHRDVKPSNLILDQEGNLRILDFGLARVEGEQSLTVTGDFLGTVMYVSPEQAMTRRVPLDHRTDIYSLGATLYELLTGAPPFKGKTHQDTLGQIIFQDPRSPRRANPRIPRDLETIVLKCLRKNPQDRYRTAEALAQDLERCARGAPVEARPQPGWERVARRAWRQRRRVAATTLFLVLLVALGYALVMPKGPVHRLLWEAPPEAYLNEISPDGRYVSYVDRRTGDLAIHDLETRADRRLTSKGPWARSQESAEWAVFSPDGQQVAYSWWNDEGFFELRIASLDGSATRVLYSDEETVSLRPDEWSSDGKEILTHLDKSDGTGEIGLISVTDGSLRVLRSFEDPQRRTASISPDGEYLAYDSIPEEEWYGIDIFLLAADGSGEIPLVEYRHDDRLLDWAADGSGIVFSNNLEPPSRERSDLLFLAVSAGSPRGAPQLLKKAVGSVHSLECTRRDGMVYTIEGPSGRDVFVATIDVASGETLAPPAKVSTRPGGLKCSLDWAPDGEHIAYLWGQPWPSIISVLNTRTSEERQLSTSPFRLGSIRWSPDGRCLIAHGFDAQHRDRQRGIYNIDAQTGEVTSVVDGDVGAPEWAPDGKAVFYCLKFEDRWRLIRRELETGHEQEVMVVQDYERGREYAVSPDGKTIAYRERDEVKQIVFLKLLPVGGGAPREIFRVRGVGEVRGFAFTPDGRHVIALVGKRYEDEVARRLWRIPVEGGEPLRLSLSIRRLDGFCIHPDGKRLAFTAQPASWEVWAMEGVVPSPIAAEEARNP